MCIQKATGVAIFVVGLCGILSTMLKSNSGGAIVSSGELLSNICMVGYAIVMCIGINFLTNGDKKIRTVNMLPAILVPVVYEVIKKLF